MSGLPEGRDERQDPPARQSAALLVFAGILASRVVGFLRDRALAHFFGVGLHADVFRTALRGPNILQNLLGEGTVSAAFIPVYSRLLNEGRAREAGRFAGAVFGFLLALAAGLSLAGILLARPLVTVMAPGFLADAEAVASGHLAADRFELAVVAVRVIFPMTGLLVLSAWALGVLNSHRRFLLPYLAPVLWNVAIMAGLFAVAWGLFDRAVASDRDALLIAACVGALVGGALQFAVQLPLVARVMEGFRVSLSTRVVGVRDALRAVGPVIAGRGVYQLSAYLDLLLASLLTAGAVGALGWAQTLYVLPVSLFGLSVAQAELPELARHARGDGVDAAFVARLARSLRQMAFFTVPTALGYVLFGHLLVGALYRTGRFTPADNWLVAFVLAGYALGIVPTTASRLLQNAFYALDDTRTPARIAVVRVVVSAAAAVPLMFALDGLTVAWLAPGTEGAAALRLGAGGLAAASAVAAWVELAALWRRLAARLPGLRLPTGRIARLALLALATGLVAAGLWWLVPRAWHVAATALVVVGLYATCYLLAARALGLSELSAWLGRARRRA